MDALFGALQSGSDQNRLSAAADIWRLWSEPLSPTAEVLLEEANSALQAQEFEAARTILDQTIKAYPGMAEAYNRRAALYYLTRNYDAALADFSKTLELEPRHFAALAGRGLVYQARGDWIRALEAYRAALAINPTMAGVQHEIQVIESQQSQL